jgi:L-ascorbate metabolism protein UlaG (beta-lactamase superfamily)
VRLVLITKWTHSCARIEHDGAVLVIDPGVWSEPRALAGADAVLVSHEHGDHIDVLRLAGLGVPVYAPAGASIPATVGWTPVEVGAELTVAGLSVRAVGGRHATIHGGQPDLPNVGWLVDAGDGALYHPGDSVHVPAAAVRWLGVPMQAGWLKLTEAIDFVNAVRPERAFGIHEGQVNDRGITALSGWLADQTRTEFEYLPPGTPVPGTG